MVVTDPVLLLNARVPLSDWTQPQLKSWLKAVLQPDVSADSNTTTNNSTLSKRANGSVSVSVSGNNSHNGIGARKSPELNRFNVASEDLDDLLNEV